MEFYLSTSPELLKIEQKDIIVLNHDNWDDWFRFETVYRITYFNSSGEAFLIGSTKIGQVNMVSGQRSPNLPDNFYDLNEEFFSLGQDSSYYERLNSYGEDFRFSVLNALRDIALKEETYKVAKTQFVTSRSLMRDVSSVSVEGQFRRLAQGISILTEYNFTFTIPGYTRNQEEITLDFHVKPKSNPPTNIHVIIGRNGVGKTHLFTNIVMSLLEITPPARVKRGKFSTTDTIDIANLFANLISVSFSAFDELQALNEERANKRLKYSYIGLKRFPTNKNKDQKLPPKSPIILKNEFVRSVEKCIIGAKNSRWISALRILESDPIFAEAEVSKIAKLSIDDEFEEISGTLFHKLSSGHKIVLLTITKLVETLEEKSLVLLDEPEAYLHPPLLSSFVRALSELLTKRNAVAIIGTHSPVVLQEVPRSCVWKLRRQGAFARAERLEIESFGENVGVLTQEIFGLEVTDAGFHTMLKKIADSSLSYDDAISSLEGQLGMEGKSILRNLLHNKE
ncbi:AAA family ATPase [Flavobacterium ginsengisoli]|uniref:AAA family ATPase n=1 Tax=Flavobacterium ginsengisoli TaxID=871694 RepID=A0ABP7FWE6_9FLAO|nr:AAA family ATPase [Flavobacterium ginsengisoli]